MHDHKVRIVPLGGLGEVGKNMMSIEYGNEIVVIDAGIMFPENDMLGIDYIIPDFQYLRDRADAVRGTDVKAVLKALNPVIRGWANYFRIGTASQAFKALDSW